MFLISRSSIEGEPTSIELEINEDVIHNQLARSSTKTISVCEIDFAFSSFESVAYTLTQILELNSLLKNKIEKSNIRVENMGRKNKASCNGLSVSFNTQCNIFMPIKTLLQQSFFWSQEEDFKLDRGSIISKMERDMIIEENNMFAIVGPHGSGRKTIASTLAQNLIASYHWSEVFSIDLSEVYSTHVAGADFVATLLATKNKIHESC